MSESTPSRFPATRVVAVVSVLVLLVLVGRRLGQALPQLAAWMDGLGVWGPIVFVTSYVVTTLAFIPGAWMTVLAGALFGFARGTALVMAGATLGAAAAFLVSRHLARDLVMRRVADRGRFAAIDRAVGSQGFRIVLLMRLSPVFPFNLLNYSLGITTVRFIEYLAASVGMLPATLLYCYYGVLAGDVARLAGGVAAPRGPGYYGVLVLGLLATIGVTTVVTRAARAALREATGEADPA